MKLTGSLLSLVLAGLAVPSALSAAEQEAPGIFSLNLGLAIWTWVIFLITLGVLAWKVFPAISGGLEARQAKIQGAIDEARRAQEEARGILEEHRRQLEAARAEAQSILGESREAGERLRGEILAEARVQAEELVQRARREMTRERDEIMIALRTESVDVALAAAEKLLRRKLDDEESRRFVRDTVVDLR